MILDKGPRALICAGFFCLAAALGSAAQAAQVYPGCAQPGPTGKVWYVDPVNGKTPAAGGNGSQARPGTALRGVLSGQWGVTGSPQAIRARCCRAFPTSTLSTASELRRRPARKTRRSSPATRSC